MANAPNVEPMLSMPKSVAFLADAVLDRHFDILEGNLPRAVVDHQLLRAQ